MLLKYILVPNLVKFPQTIGTLGFNCFFKRRITQQIWKDETNGIIRKEKKVFLIDNKMKWDEILPLISRDVSAVNALGFDTEWVFKGGKRNPVALLQLATYSGICVVLRLNYLQGVPHSLKDLLEDKEIVKVGVSCETDNRHLTLDYNINVRSCMDLRHLALEDNLKNIKFSLENLARHYLGKNLNKNWKLQASNWESRTLAQRQVTYAAEDSLIGLHILLAQLNRLWKPVLQEKWEKLTCMAIKEICQPFLDVDFQYRHQFGNSSNSEIQEKLKLPNNNCLDYNDNFEKPQLQKPNGELLNYCRVNRALWYVEKGLGDLVSKYPLIVKLKFEPSEKSRSESMYRSNLKLIPKNCFVCGSENSHIFKNIVPYEYRKYFPDFLLSRTYNIVILCNQCLRISSHKDYELSKKLAEECDASFGTVTNEEGAKHDRLNIVRKAGEALKNNRNQLTLEEIQNLEKILMDYFDTDAVTEDLLTQAVVLQAPEVDHVPRNYKIYKYYERVGLIQLEKRCRQWFLDSMKPKFMPENWSVLPNMNWLKTDMARYPLEDEIRKDYKIALVGTEGEIDVPYQPYKRTSMPILNSGNSNEDYKISQPYVKR
ncbi:Exonuclease 3'-5' domain-containing protein 2 [Armadillidium nasatum]|uniref:Exonuclease 3'-5' domain-containing protein 2 n=1 Tax=Armadillidium nasatum TaxID=96803 RepID=A0A5N5T4C7_9CRUS|nr:Exonuclease 3'-5' domain-containing protein 2 [Armadillidium nasatum]